MLKLPRFRRGCNLWKKSEYFVMSQASSHAQKGLIFWDCRVWFPSDSGHFYRYLVAFVCELNPWSEIPITFTKVILQVSSVVLAWTKQNISLGYELAVLKFMRYFSFISTIQVIRDTHLFGVVMVLLLIDFALFICFLAIAPYHLQAQVIDEKVHNTQLKFTL